jgi:hypothetical protein
VKTRLLTAAAMLLPLALLPALLPAADPAPPPRPVADRIAPTKAGDPDKPRGLKPTPPHMLFSVPRFVPTQATLPAAVSYVPKQLSVWNNNKYGCCVTSEEAFNQGACGTFITDATVLSWARQRGYLNGAYLTEVMDSMRKSGFAQGGNVYGVGGYTQVNFGSEPTLQAALAVAPVKVGLDADALPGTAGGKQGWYAVGGSAGHFRNEDHCVTLCGYGPASTLYSAMGVPLPAAIPATKPGYLLFTWGTIGFVDHDWIMSTVAEAYLRDPTATVNGKPQPNPGPAPGPTPPPQPPTPPTPPAPPVPGKGFTGSLVYVDGALTQVVHGTVTSEAAIKNELTAAGISPEVIADLLQLVADVRAKRGIAVIAADVAAIIRDLRGN